jgi:hypothetical protein
MGFSAVISALDRSERHLGDGPWNRHSYFIAYGTRGSRRFKSSRERETQQRNFAVR